MTFKMRLMAYEPNGDLLGPLPTPQGMSASIVYGDLGSINLTYSRKASGTEWLDGPCEVAIHVRTDAGWVEADDARFVMLADDSDEVADTEAPKYVGNSYGWLLSKALVDDGPTEQMKEGKRHLGAVSAGSIMTTLAAEAQARGVMAGADFSSFSATHDSNGTAWTNTVDVGYEVGLDLASVLRNLDGEDWRAIAALLQELREQAAQSSLQ